ncbi:MAG TPA: phosphatase PAP2 family protein [Chthoniobacterales bacterium]|jgi:membrane-associated phospholipid phosphatase|nr:phosphatase PAP2 family protein [Chthoniobacterales bacterium]
MRRVVFAFIIGIAAGVSVRAQTDLMHVDPWARHDAAVAAQDRQDAPEFSLAAETLGTPSDVSPLAAPVEDLFKKNYWFLLILDTKEVFTAPAHWDTRDWMVLGGIAAGIGTVAAFDNDIEHAIRGARNNTVTSIFDNVQPLGNEYAIGIVGSFYIYGEIFKDPRAKTTALDSIAASAIASGIVTNSFKYVIGRGRPTDGHGAYNFRPFSGQDSFSSGHTTEAFTLASVISEHYDSLWVQVPAYGLASAVGYARLNNNRHWPSDVLAGAVIGTFVGKTVVHFNQRHRQVSIQPIVGPDIHGAQMSIPW